MPRKRSGETGRRAACLPAVRRNGGSTRIAARSARAPGELGRKQIVVLLQERGRDFWEETSGRRRGGKLAV